MYKMKRIQCLPVTIIVAIALANQLSTTLASGNFQESMRYHNILTRSHAANLPKKEHSQISYANYRNFQNLKYEYLNLEKLLEDAASLDSSNVSLECLTAVELIKEGVKAEEIWALEFLDAAGKPPSGILQVDFVWPGQYDECIKISTSINMTTGKDQVKVQGKYYRLEIGVPLPDFTGKFFVKRMPLAAIYLSELTYGICVPSQCSVSDVIALGNIGLDLINSYLPSKLQNMTQGIKSVDHPRPAKFEPIPVTMAAIVILSILAVFLLTGTLYDLFIYQPALKEEQSNLPSSPPLDDQGNSINTNTNDLNATIISTGFHDDESHLLADHSKLSSIRQRIKSYETLSKVMMAFSMYSSGKKILSTKTAPNQIKAVNGIRVLSLGWVILGHTYYFSVALCKNIVVLQDWIQRWSFQAVGCAFFSVDSFFLLSGMLGAYLTLKEMQKKNGKINWLMYYFHRFWRLTPAYMLVIMTSTGLFHYLGDGPFWPDRVPDYHQCTTFWWRNLLYIQNFFPVAQMCVGWSWYLANDMQFFMITPLILIPLYRKPIIGYVIIAVLMMEQFIFRGVISVYYNFKMNIPLPEHQMDWFDQVYGRPYSRISPYLIGILTGYTLWKTDCKVHLPKFVWLLGWIVSLVCITSVVYGTLEESRGHLNSVQVDGLYNSLCKTVWSLGLAWIVFACNTGNGGIVTEFLSSGLLGPLGRLNYCAYLVHPVIMYAFILNQRYSLYFTDLNIVYMFLGHWTLSYAIAMVVSLAFEAPMIGLERIFLRKPKQH